MIKETWGGFYGKYYLLDGNRLIWEKHDGTYLLTYKNDPFAYSDNQELIKDILRKEGVL